MIAAHVDFQLLIKYIKKQRDLHGTKADSSSVWYTSTHATEENVILPKSILGIQRAPSPNAWEIMLNMAQL